MQDEIISHRSSHERMQVIYIDNFSDAQLFIVQTMYDYFMDIGDFLHTGMALSNMTLEQKKQLVVKEVDYQLIAGNLYKFGEYGMLRRFILEHERISILEEAQGGIVGVHYEGK
jgi:hypothetical protein